MILLILVYIFTTYICTYIFKYICAHFPIIKNTTKIYKLSQFSKQKFSYLFLFGGLHNALSTIEIFAYRNRVPVYTFADKFYIAQNIKASELKINRRFYNSLFFIINEYYCVNC